MSFYTIQGKDQNPGMTPSALNQLQAMEILGEPVEDKGESGTALLKGQFLARIRLEFDDQQVLSRLHPTQIWRCRMPLKIAPQSPIQRETNTPVCTKVIGALIVAM
jgi:hypothetical protein